MYMLNSDTGRSLLSNLRPVYPGPKMNPDPIYGRHKKKFPFTIRTTGRAIPFRSRLISVRLPFLSVFKPFPFCPKGSPSVLVNDPDGVIKRAQSLIAQEGSQQFSDRDRARARAT